MTPEQEAYYHLRVAWFAEAERQGDHKELQALYREIANLPILPRFLRPLDTKWQQFDAAFLRNMGITPLDE